MTHPLGFLAQILKVLRPSWHPPRTTEPGMWARAAFSREEVLDHIGLGGPINAQDTDAWRAQRCVRIAKGRNTKCHIIYERLTTNDQ